MTQTPPNSTGALWARFRFSVVGSLLSSPPAPGALKTAIRSLAAKTWSHQGQRALWVKLVDWVLALWSICLYTILRVA
jgi:hypothetical protein